MAGLINGELRLSIDIILGVILGEIIMLLGLPDKLMKYFLPFLTRHNIPSSTALALSASIASSRTGAAIISSSLNDGLITERCAIWSVLMLPFPAYLRRWPSTFIMSISIAGKAGGLFAVTLLLRSAVRFVVAYMFLKSEKASAGVSSAPVGVNLRRGTILSRLIKTLPVAWIFFALTYSLVPVINTLFTRAIYHEAVPVTAISAGSIAHVSAALAMAGGALAKGELNTSRAVFALVLGSGLGTASRILRQNAGYYFGLFSPKTAQKMLVLNFITIMPIIIINILIAWLAAL